MWAVGYVAGKHLASFDADNCILALFFMDTIACEAVVKMTQLRLRSSSFHEHGSSSGAVGFHDSGSSSGICSFSHINILIVLACLKLNGKWILLNTQN